MKLTDAEAHTLINMMKHHAEKQDTLAFPPTRGQLCFDVIGERRTDEFVVNIHRKGINAAGCTYQGRIKSNNVILLRLDINPTSTHRNPLDGEIIMGSHLHIYDEETELRHAIPFDPEDNDLVSLCYAFFEKFNIVKPPRIIQQIDFKDME